jgi:hypothetical protein
MKEYQTWHIFQFYAYDWKAWKEMEEWLKVGPKGEVHRFGWRDGCSSVTGIAMKENMDAMMFKLLFAGRSMRDGEGEFRTRAIEKLSGALVEQSHESPNIDYTHYDYDGDYEDEEEEDELQA